MRISRSMAFPILILGVVAMGFYFGQPHVLGQWVTQISVRQGTIVQSVVASGRVETPSRVNLGSQTTGTVEGVLVSEGQTVPKGKILVVLHAEEAEAALSQAQAALDQANAKHDQFNRLILPSAKQTLEQARVTQTNARRQFDRVAKLAERDFTTRANLDNAKRAYDLAKSQTKAAELAVASASPGGSDVAVALAVRQQALAAVEAARSRLELTRIRSPVNGTVLARKAEPGMVVQPGTPLIELVPTAQMRLVVQIDERNLGLIKPGQKALASADAYPDKRFNAIISTIMPAVDSQRGSFEVKLDVALPPDYLKEGMSVSIDIEVARRNQALLLPIDAVYDSIGGSPHVLVVYNGRAHDRPVMTGLRGNGLIEIVSGVTMGDKVIVSSDAIKPGQRVRVRSSGLSP